MGVTGRFVDGAAGPLALVAFAPPPGTPVRFGALHLPAFGDEMNKARHVVAAQARTFAAIGGLTMVLDPRGTGDSAGEFAVASWTGWREDAMVAWSALRESLPPQARCVLWGLRLGGLLAADLACRRDIVADALLLWQPVATGRGFFNQFLRIAAAQGIESGAAGVTREALRESLRAGGEVAIGGYTLSRALVDGAEAVDCTALDAPEVPVFVRETGPQASPELAPASQRLIAQWRASGTPVDAAAVVAPPFWTSLELEDAPSLLASSADALSRWSKAG